ncbi:MAG: HEAT repeat domain-containing protein [Micrococcus sp.]|nr:HEAT repeat domain-containing protein [Micrococcus sp.]
MSDVYPDPSATPSAPPLDPYAADTALRRLHVRVDAAVAHHREGPVAQTAVRMLAGQLTPDDVTGGIPAALIGEDSPFSASATGALTLTTLWHSSAWRTLRAVLEADSADPEARAAVLLVMAARADQLRREAAVDSDLVRVVSAACEDPDPRVREAAASALGELAQERDLEPTVAVLGTLVMDVDADLAAAAELALARLADRFDAPGLRASTDY